MFITLRSKLILVFSLLIGVFVVVSVVAYWFDSIRFNHEHYIAKLGRIENLVEKIGKAERDFLTDETINPTYFATGESPILLSINQYYDEALSLIGSVAYRGEMSDSLQQFQPTLTTFLHARRSTFDTLRSVIEDRGFRDFGVEGQMRRYIHEIEVTKLNYDEALMLTIRRHEKDFIIRKDSAYIGKLTSSVALLEQKIRHYAWPDSTRTRFSFLLENYKQSFIQLANLEMRIGFESKLGIRGRIASLDKSILSHLHTHMQHVELLTEQNKRSMRALMVMIVIAALGFNLFLAIVVIGRLDKPIKALSKAIGLTISNRFNRGFDIPQFKSGDEISSISHDVQSMLNEVRSSIALIEDKNIILEHSQRSITDSIRYARTIQAAVLPSDDDFMANFKEHFAIYLPQHIVSGDFYWMIKKKKTRFIALGDCTGHGVPGAFMSMISITLLNKIVAQAKVYSPASILENLSDEIRIALQQDKGLNMDGLEIALCALTEPNEDGIAQLTFSGAKRPVYVFQSGHLIPLKSTKRHIGGEIRPDKLPFQEATLLLRPGDVVYMFSDGVTDMANAERKKFSSPMLEKLLLSVAHLPLSEQKTIIESALREHGQGSELRDDLSMIAFRL